MKDLNKTKNKEALSLGESLRIYRWMTSWLKPYMSRFLLVLLAGLIMAGAELVMPKVVQYVLDDIVPAGDRARFLQLLPWLIALPFAAIGAGIAQEAIGRPMQERIAANIQFGLFAKIRSLGFSYFETHPVGESLGLLQSETAALQDFYRKLLPGLIRNSLFTVLALFCMASTSGIMLLMTVPAILLFYASGPFIERAMGRASRAWADERVRLYGSLHETLSGKAELRANGAERWTNARTEKRMAENDRLFLRTYKLINARQSARTLSFYAGSLAALLYAIYAVPAGKLSVGAAAAFLLYHGLGMRHMMQTISLLAEQRILIHQMRRLYDLMGTAPMIADSPNVSPIGTVYGSIMLDHVSFAYEGRPSVLTDVQLSIPAGKRIALVGPSGGGKSTLLKLIPRFYDPTYGRIVIDGLDIRDWPLGVLRETIGIVFQETYLFGFSVRENIRFGRPDATDDEVVEAARKAAAHTFIEQLPQGYDTPLGERGVILSGGQKQRIAIARMLLSNPAIVLLDEATSALDNESEREVTEALRQLAHGRTIVAVAHRISTIQDYDLIVHVENGRIVEQGTYEELLSRGGAFTRLVEGMNNEEGGKHDAQFAMDLAAR
ncbi:ABC transporter ATP-binding protein [Paenibacillus kobensis]|uniref:ABC transporter ATP-binding protein n=1 Tax=Paenibacillus kobensis TaxID=59841 RepID=UPI000FD6CB1C|nr:ABC transporter ATP-binding protein [Paenibacillus kobensis]